MMKGFRTSLACACLLLAACISQAPREHGDTAPTLELRLSPASLGHAMAMQQQLTFHFRQQQRTLDALLEVDAGEVRLEVQSMGQSALRLRWDGKHLDQQRADWLPKALRGEQVLSDLELAQWPVEAIRAGLPPGWTLVEDGTTRQLRKGDTTVATVHYPAPDRIEIEHADFRLSILSVPVETAQ
jgi:hypothetical protein